MIQRSRIPFLCALVAAMFIIIGPPAPALAAPSYVPGELIIRYKATTRGSERAALRGQMRADLKRDLRFLDLEHVKLRDMSVEEAVTKFKRHKDVLYVEPNYVLTADVIPNDTRFAELYGMRNTGQTGGTVGADIKAYLAWGDFTGDPNLKIGIIDTGVDYNHPDLQANAWTNPGEIPGNNIDDDGNGYVDDVHGYDFYNNDGDPFDDNGHGSHCAGTIAGVGNNNLGVTGVNWGAKVVAIKFLSGAGSGSTDGAIRGVQYAMAVGVRLTSNSWGGGGFSQALLDAINAAGAAGQLFVAAAGNDGVNTDTSPHYPSSYDTPYILAVGASDHNDAMAYFSNYGATTVDLFAPGVDILSCQPGGGYQLLSGTSMATPHASGVVGLAMGRFPAMTNLQIKQLVMNAADLKAAFTGKCLTGGRLNAFMTIAEPDSIPPGRIADLATANPGSNTMGLTWTAPGDDGNTGRAARYEIRYSTSPIDDTNWASATLVTGPDPLPAGSAEAFEVPGLAFSTTYYFAIKAFDEFSNAAPLSNVPMGSTLGIPDIAAAPAWFSSTLLTGAVETQTLTLTNAGQGTLDFTVPVPELLFSQPVLYPYEPVPKGGDDVRVGAPVLDNKGGPDGYGHRWTDSNEPGGPVFDWVDITSVGTPVALTGDDATSAPIAMEMDFPFYGNSFNSLRVCTNGFLSFTDASTAYSNQGLPNTGAPANLVAPLWDDLNFGSAQLAYTYFDGTRFIVSWVGVPHYSTGGPYTFQAILYPTGEIRYQYLSVAEPTNSLTIGIQNAARDIGLTVAYNAEYVADNLAIRIYPLSQWLTVTPTSGRIHAGLSQDLQVRFNALGMMGGTYEGNVRVLSNDPDGSPLVLPATLHVTGAPDLAVNPPSLDFDTPFAGATLTRTLTVSNPGTDNLVVSNITTTHATVTVDLTSFTLAPKAARNLTVTWHPTAPMTLNALVQIASNDPDTPVKDVAVSGQALVAPTFSVSPEALAVTLLTNTATSRTLRVSNSGGSNYVFTAEAMVLSPSGTVAQHGDADNVELEKGAPDVQFGPAPDRAGGPDVFGYTYQDSDESGGPSFGWVDIRPVGTQINMTGDDVNTGPYPVGFAFPFYGKTFDSFRIATNGFVSFTSTKTALTNTTLPNSGSAVPENLLAVFWDDLNFQTYKRAWYYNDGSKLVIQYQDVAKYGDYTHPNTFEVILYPNGTIVYQYLSMTATTKNSATIGIQNEARNDGLQVVYNALYVKDNLAIRFRPPARFLTVSPNGGTVPAGGFLDLNVGFNAAGMFGGLYDGIVRIKGNDPVLPQKDVPADLTVIGVPDISVTPAALAFGSVFIGYPHLLQATVRNVGTDVLHVTSITSSDPAYGLNPTSFNVPALGSALVDVSFNPTSVGSFPATLTLNSDDPDTPAATVALTGNGIVAPDIGVSPPSIATTLNIPGTDVKTLTISNTGGSDLNFTVGTLITALSVPVFEYEGAEPGKDEPDTRPGILGSGGPDLFGYTWRDSDDPGGPAFDWVDVTGIGTPITLPSGDDANVQGVPVGFDFPFYGATFNTVNVCTNGWLSFTNTTTSLSNYALPSSSAPENLLAVFWDDLNPGTATPRLYTYRDGTRFILSYVAVPRYSSGGPYTFQVILYPSGRILYQYLDMQGTRLNEATIGIQNAAKNDGLTAAYNMDYVHNNMAVEFATIPDYLTVSPSMGTIPAGGSMDIAVNFNTAGMFGGTYNGSLRVASNDPDEALVTVPTTLTAVGSPDIAAVPASLDFGWQYVGLTRDLTVEVRNAGSDVLTITGGSIDSPDYALVGATFPITLGNRAQTTLTVRFAPLAACSPCAGNLVLASDDPDTPNLAVPLTGIGVIPPEIGVAPTSLRAALATTLCSAALTTTKLLIVANTGGSDLTYTAEALSALPASVNTPAGENAKDDKGTPGAPVVAGSGGPDAFGYRWADSDDPAGPAFNWVDISVGGIPIPLNGDDQNLGPFALPFAFPFYGNTFDSFRISSNGFVSFTNTASGITNYLLPNTSAPENLLAAFWDDLDFRPGSGAARAFSHYDGIKFIISFLDVPHYSTGGPYTFQILLYPSGTVDFQYLDMQGDRLDEATIGIQNATKDVGLTVVYNASYVKDNLCVRFSNRPGWLTVTPLSGTVPAGGQDTVLVRFGATGLADGDYTGVVRIASNDLDEPLTTVPCDLHVGVAQAALDISPNTLNRSSHGNWVSGKVTPPAGCPPPGIRTSSVLLQGTVPVALEGPITYTDLYVQYKFDRAPLQVILPVGDAVEVNVTGEVADVTWFAAKDTVRVLKPAMNVSGALAEYGTDGAEAPQFNAGSPILLSWQDPEGHAATSYQLWYSENAGESWTLAADGLTERQYTWVVPATPTERAMLDLAALDGLGVMGSWLSQVFTVALGPAGVDDQELPDRFGLRFAGANPAARPRFELALPERAQVEVRVYDVRGALVRSLAAGEFAAGRHPLHWDGAAASGQAAQPGIYFVRAKAGGHDITLRFVLVH